MQENTPPTIPTPPPQPIVKPIEKPKPQGTGLIMMLLFLILILVASTGYLAYQSFLLNQKLSKSTYMTQSSPTPSGTPDPTANWQTYTNTFYNLQIKYPQNWTGPSRVSGTMEQGSVTFTGNEGTINIATGNGFGGLTCDPNSKQIVTLVDKTLTECTSTDSNGIKTWFLGKEINQTDSIQIKAKSNSSSSSDIALIDQILSTVNFVTPSSSIDTSNWKTYTGNGFSFKYPSNYTQSTDSGLLNDSTKSWIFSVDKNTTYSTIQDLVSKRCGTNLCTITQSPILAGSTEFINNTSQYPSIEVAIQHNNAIYEIHFNARNPNQLVGDDIKNILDQILLTFQFTQ